MNPTTTLTNNNPPAAPGCGLNPNPICREESETPHNVPDSWATAVELALAEGPDQPIIDDITLTDGDRVASFHPIGACRRDRPDLDVPPKSTLNFVTDPTVQLSSVFVTTQPLDPNNGESADAFAPDVSATFEVPDREGTLIVEATLTRAVGTTTDTCTSLRVATDP